MAKCTVDTVNTQSRLFDRDVNCIQTFFAKKYNIHFESKPLLKTDVKAKMDLTKDPTIFTYFKEQLGEHAGDIALLVICQILSCYENRKNIIKKRRRKTGTKPKSQLKLRLRKTKSKKIWKLTKKR